MKAMIFAAGLGTRLKPLTDTMPKAMVPVAGKPLIEHVLSKLEGAGYDDVVVNTHHFASQIEDYLATRNGKAKTSVSREVEEPLETGGGIRKAAPLLRGCGRFLVHNVDILSNLDLSAFNAAVPEDSFATLVVSSRETSRYLLFDGDMRLVGWTNIKTGEVKAVKPGLDPDSCQRFAFAGIHVLSEAVLPEMEDWPEKFSIIDFYLKKAADHPVYGYVPKDFRMLDVGKVQALSEAENLFFLEH